MEDLDDLILFENEKTSLDFKRDEYQKGKHSSLLKDVMAMANASTKEDRYIIIGLKPKNVDDRGFAGIDELTDAATYQQLINQNIEPELSIEYIPYQIKGYNLGIFKITNCDNPPYLMKKDYGNGKDKLREGSGFIRKGSSQKPLMRVNYDKFTKDKIDSKYFNEPIKFKLITETSNNELSTVNIKKLEFPSDIEAKEINEVLTRKKEERKIYTDEEYDVFKNYRGNDSWLLKGYSSPPYENRDISTLESNLENIKDTYQEDDYYFLFEENSNKINLEITNYGKGYIEDATIVVRIPKTDGLFVSERIFDNPNRDITDISSRLNYYPEVTEDEDYHIIKNNVGDIKHQLPQEVFEELIRIVIDDRIDVEFINLTCEIFAKNIQEIITENLTIRINKQDTTGNKP